MITLQKKLPKAQNSRKGALNLSNSFAIFKWRYNIRTYSSYSIFRKNLRSIFGEQLRVNPKFDYISLRTRKRPTFNHFIDAVV